MESQTETQEKVVVEQVPDRQLQYEKTVNDRFEAIEKQLSMQPTKDEFATMLEGLANKEDVARLNTYVHNFSIGVQILEKSSKWVLFAVITVGGVAAGILVIKNGFIIILSWLGFTQIK